MKVEEVLKACRDEARKVGLVFKRSKNNINNTPAYYFADRESGIAVIENCTLATAYNNVCSGYIMSYDKQNRLFKGI